METTANLEYLTAFLAREGYPISETGDNFVTFQHGHRTFVIALDLNDHHYFRMILPNFATIDDSLDLDRVSIIASHVTAEVKAAKVFAVGDKVWATIETLVESHDQTAAVFSRMLELLGAAEELFLSMFNREEEAEAETAEAV
ncbi:MAG: hypothetical protein AAGA48_12025 [Myxococcota bacterium]